MTIKEADIDYVIELRGVYDGWSVAVMKDGSRVNRWAGEGSRRERWTDAFLAGEPSNGRWF